MAERYKLLIEGIETKDVEYLVEGKSEEERIYRFKGPFLMAESKNRNGRIYPKHIMEKEVNRYSKEEIAEKRSVGSLCHPSEPTVNFTDASHIIEDLHMEGNIGYGTARALSTPMGQTLKALMRDGVTISVSSRAIGSLQNGIVGDNFRLLTVDCVQNPSYSGAVTESIVENFDYIIQGNKFVAVAVEKYKDELAKHGTKSLYEDLNNFLTSLKRKI